MSFTAARFVSKIAKSEDRAVSDSISRVIQGSDEKGLQWAQKRSFSVSSSLRLH
jgi:hypothetical protein